MERPSGSAELTSQARQIMAKIADKGVGKTGTVTVSTILIMCP